MRYLPYVFLTLLYGCADSLFYQPDRFTYTTPVQFGLQYREFYFPSEDGTRLHGWYVRAIGKRKGVVAHYHGNAQNLSSHFTQVNWLPKRGYDLFLFDYRGYGKSRGQVDRQGVHLDSLAFLEYVLSNADGESNIFVLGQSLGGAAAMDAVASVPSNKIKALIIESTFVDYRMIASDSAGILGGLSSVLVSNDYSPAESLKRISVPVLLIHGTEDEVIPFEHSQQLYEMASEPKEFWKVEGALHLQTFGKFRFIFEQRLVNYLQSKSISGE